MKNVIYIFLDIDGVLATQRAISLKWKDYAGDGPEKDFRKNLDEKNLCFPGLSGKNWPFDQECISNMHYYQRTFRERGYDVQYVISSTWRGGKTVDELDDLFNLKGLILSKIVGKTGHGNKRGEEILKWLKDNNAEDEVFLVIDDECSFDIAEFIDEKHLIDTSFNTGFDYSKLIEATRKTNELLKLKGWVEKTKK